LNPAQSRAICFVLTASAIADSLLAICAACRKADFVIKLYKLGDFDSSEKDGDVNQDMTQEITFARKLA